MKKVQELGSSRFHLNNEDWKKIYKGAFIAILGAILTYGTDIIMGVDFGRNAPIITAIWSILVNVGWKWIKNNQPATK